MRKILGPARSDDGYRRIKTNQEINDILKGQNIIGFIKNQRLNWLGHVERTTEDNNMKKIKRWKPCLKDQLEDLTTLGRWRFGRYKEHECTQMEECSTEQR